VALVLAVVVMLAAATPAAAQVLASESVTTTTLHVPAGKSAPLMVGADVERIVVAQPEIAKVDQVGPQSLYVLGRDIGQTNLLIYGAGGRLLRTVDVEVGYDAPQLQADLRDALPAERIAVQSLTGGLLLTGAVSTSEAQATAEALAEHAAPGSVVSILDVRPSQVRLEVRLGRAIAGAEPDVGSSEAPRAAAAGTS